MKLLRAARYSSALLLVPICVAISSYASPASAQPAVAGGGGHSLFVAADGSASASGHNGYGNLGNGLTAQESTPVAIAGLSNIIAVAAGVGPSGAHSMALTAAGRIYVWGYNSHGQLGTTSCASQASQLPYGCSVPVLLPLTDVVAIAAGELHSLALTSSGVLYAWGRFAPDILSRVS